MCFHDPAYRRLISTIDIDRRYHAPARLFCQAVAPRPGPPAAGARLGRTLVAGRARGASARRFRTALRDGVAAGPNFAGHLTVVTWGCGTQCRSDAIVDARTERVYADSALDFGCHDPGYRRASRLVVQRPDWAALGPCSPGPIRSFRWAAIGW
jgi:hypothetical protein